jgi:hypothetical protein
MFPGGLSRSVRSADGLRGLLSHAAYISVLVVFTGMAARVWWLSTILPCMDHTQFLVFVRVVQDWNDPASPFHGTYSVGPWFMPTTLPIHLVSLLSRILPGHSLEDAGRVLLGGANVGIVAASAYTLHLLKRPRWAIVLLFPLVHSRWSVAGGFTVFATSMPLVVLGWALAVRWLRRLDVVSGVAFGACLVVTLLWHGIAFVVAGMGFAVLWLLWRPRDLRTRALGAVPTLAALLQCFFWISRTFGKPASPVSPPSWLMPLDSLDAIVENVWASVPHAHGLALAFGALVCAGLVLCPSNLGALRSEGKMWRTDNPFLVVSLVYLAAYFMMPLYGYGVEGLSNRFAYPAALAFVFAWNLPDSALARRALVIAVLGFSWFCLDDLAGRFRSFHRDTRGASALIDRLGPYDTLYYFPTDRGVSKDFAPDYVPLRELQQHSTIREGALPNSSFAGYGINPVSYVGNVNPMPGLTGPARAIPQMTRFDYVLARRGQGPREPMFRLVGEMEGWELYGVCGSRRFPQCERR